MVVFISHYPAYRRVCSIYLENKALIKRTAVHLSYFLRMIGVFFVYLVNNSQSNGLLL